MILSSPTDNIWIVSYLYKKIHYATNIITKNFQPYYRY
nr:MAG TPA: hypothetical protein [Microviridae sp.]